MTEHRVPDYVRNIGPVVASIRREPFQDSYEWAVTCKSTERPEPWRPYSTHIVAIQPDTGEWISTGNGHYDMAWQVALDDMRNRA